MVGKIHEYILIGGLRLVHISFSVVIMLVLHLKRTWYTRCDFRSCPDGIMFFVEMIHSKKLFFLSNTHISLSILIIIPFNITVLTDFEIMFGSYFICVSPEKWNENTFLNYINHLDQFSCCCRRSPRLKHVNIYLKSNNSWILAKRNKNIIHLEYLI